MTKVRGELELKSYRYQIGQKEDGVDQAQQSQSRLIHSDSLDAEVVNDLLAEDENQQVDDERDVVNRVERREIIQQPTDAGVFNGVDHIADDIGRGDAVGLIHEYLFDGNESYATDVHHGSARFFDRLNPEPMFALGQAK